MERAQHVASPTLPVYWLPLAIVLIVMASFVATSRVVASYGTSTTVRWYGDLYECGYDPGSVVRCAKQEFR